MFRTIRVLFLAASLASFVGAARANVLYSSPGPFFVDDNGSGVNLPGMTVSRDSGASDTLYFRFVAEPGSDVDDEPYFAGFQLYQGGSERLGIGNTAPFVAYSAYLTSVFDIDLNSANPEPTAAFQYVRDTDVTTLVFKVQYNAGALDDVTVWLDPDPAKSEAQQEPSLTTPFTADAGFDQIHLREGGNGPGGWTFSSIAIATTFGEVLCGRVGEPTCPNDSLHERCGPGFTEIPGCTNDATYQNQPGFDNIPELCEEGGASVCDEATPCGGNGQRACCPFQVVSLLYSHTDGVCLPDPGRFPEQEPFGDCCEGGEDEDAGCPIADLSTPCATDGDCPAGSWCTGGTCQVHTQLCDFNSCTCANITCAADSDCVTGQICDAGECKANLNAALKKCQRNEDCPYGESCTDFSGEGRGFGGSDHCREGTIPVPGCTGDCTCGHYGDRRSKYTCFADPASYDETSNEHALPPLAEPDTNATQLVPTPTPGRRGYADIHVHLFGDLAHGGGVLAGRPYVEEPLSGKGWDGGVSDALKQCRAREENDFYAYRKFCDFDVPGLDTFDRCLPLFIEPNSTELYPFDRINKCLPYLDDCGEFPLHAEHLVHGEHPRLGGNIFDFDAYDIDFDDWIGLGTGDRSATVIPEKTGVIDGPVFELIPIPFSSNMGWPVFNDWPTYMTTTHQQTYYRWLERAWQGGLRLIVAQTVFNEALCKSNKRVEGVGLYSDCQDSRSAIDEQIQAIKDMEAWIGANDGGWFQVVTTPDEADQALAEGKLAVVIGIEESNLFNCKRSLSKHCSDDPHNRCNDDRDCYGGLCVEAGIGHCSNDTARPCSLDTDCPAGGVCVLPGDATEPGSVCSPAYIEAEVQRIFDLGVRHIFPIHNFENAFGAPATWQDGINVGNRVSEGAWWEAEACPTVELLQQGAPAIQGHYGFRLNVAGKEIFGTVNDWLDQLLPFISVPDTVSEVYYLLGFGHLRDPFFTNVFDPILQIGTWPEPPPDSYVQTPSDQPDCHPAGLTPRGRHLIQAMMEKGILIDVDHMSNHAFDETLAIADRSALYPLVEGEPDRTKNYPVVASHVTTFARKVRGIRHERMRTPAQLAKIRELGGMVAIMTFDDNPTAVCTAGAPEKLGAACASNGDCGDGGFCHTLLDQNPTIWTDAGEVQKPYVPANACGEPSTPPTITDDCWRSSKGWAEEYQYAVDTMGGPVAIGSDFNGAGVHFAPRFGSNACNRGRYPEDYQDQGEHQRIGQLRENDRLRYPFELEGFGTFDKQQTGTKVFDYNVDGVAHIGLYPDMVADLEKVGMGECYSDALFDSADAYVRMWRRATEVASLDTDGDGTVDLADNCLTLPNPGQVDADLDGFGNACDPDFDDNGVVGISDFNRLREQFGLTSASPEFDPVVDTDANGAIGISDFNVLRAFFAGPPGPSGRACAGTAPCPLE